MNLEMSKTIIVTSDCRKIRLIGFRESGGPRRRICCNAGERTSAWSVNTAGRVIVLHMTIPSFISGTSYRAKFSSRSDP